MKKTLTAALLIALTITACKKDKKVDEATPDPYASKKAQVLETYANIAFAGYDDALTDAIALRTAVYAFTANPTQVSFDNAKSAWLQSRESYVQTEVFRFAEGPIDNINDGPEGLINAWPLDETYIDYVQGAPNAGIINDPVNYPSITAELIVNQNELGGEENISAGYHAIEFLLWGQDLSGSSAGQRSYTDYVTGSAPNADRRATYLELTSDLLVTALTQVRNAWDPSASGNYRTEFLAMSNHDALRKVFNSLKVLSGTELAGERMTVAYEHMDQEDEQSCFSDNTHRDIILDAKGIVNVYTGHYQRTNGQIVSGYSLSDLINEMNAGHNATMLQKLSTSENAIAQIAIPFDQAIINDRPDVLTAIEALIDEGNYFEYIATEDLDIVF